MYKIAALYKFAQVENPIELQQKIKSKGTRLGISGTIIVAAEGMNGTVCGVDTSIDAFVGFLKNIDNFVDLEVKYSSADDRVFDKYKVKLKREIVTIGIPNVDPNENVGAYVEPDKWTSFTNRSDVVLIDTRNEYETSIGTFEGAVLPNIESFRDFPKWWYDNKEKYAGKKIAMFCTGGIRCEKSTSFLIENGVEDVFHLKGGILKYLENIPENESSWEGECFVFDDRVSVKHGLQPGDAQMCYGCRQPLKPEELKDPRYEEGVSCARCNNKTTPSDKARFRERHRQRQLNGK